MTRTAPRPFRIDCASAKPASVPTEAWGTTLVWDLAARVGRRLAQGSADTPIAVELAVTPDHDRSHISASLRLVLRSGEQRELLTRAAVQAAWLCEQGFSHLDAVDVLRCSFRTADMTRPVFVSSPLLQEAGIPAGSYSLRDVEA